MQASSDAEQEMISVIIVMMMMMTMLMTKRNDEGVMNKDPFCSILGSSLGWMMKTQQP